MGCGKTIVGRRLAETLGKRFVDTDQEVERATGLTISEIFSRYGEHRFREEERRAVERAGSERNTVIATGGGAVLNPANVQALRRSGTVIWLVAGPEVIRRRVAGKGHRPLLAEDQGLNRIKELLEARESVYRACADLIVDTSRLTVGQVVRELVRLLREKHEPGTDGEKV